MFVIEWKLDGLTAVFEYQNGILQYIASRGDGHTGEIMPNGMHISNIRKEIKGFTGQLRGEVILPRTVFENHFKPLGYKNTRNTAVGKMRDQGASLDLLRYIKVVYFDVIGPELDELEKLNFFDNNDLERVEYRLAVDAPSIWAAYKDMARERQHLDYDVDGIVVKVNNAIITRKAGYSNFNPRAAKCIKFVALGATTKFIGITKTIGHTGAIIPTGRLEPVELGGVVISNVLLNNYDYIAELGIQINDEIKIVRAGDVIPMAVGSARTYRCPICGFEGSENAQIRHHAKL